MDEVTEALTAKGWTVPPEGQANAQVVLHGATETKRTLNTFYSGMGGYGYRGWGGMGGTGTATTTESQYTVGTLVVDIFDAKGKNLLWRGVAQDELSDKPDKNIKKLGKASDKLFKDFPRAAPRSSRTSRAGRGRAREEIRPLRSGRGGGGQGDQLGGARMTKPSGLVDRALRVFGDVRPGRARPSS
jgi:hypothetical protein